MTGIPKKLAVDPDGRCSLSLCYAQWIKKRGKKINNCKTVSINFMCRLPTLMIFGDVLVWRTVWPFLQAIYGQAHNHFYGSAVKYSWMAKWDSHWSGREPANKYKNTMFSLLMSVCPAFWGILLAVPGPVGAILCALRCPWSNHLINFWDWNMVEKSQISDVPKM